MALKPLDIFKLLPKTNCKECGFPTCLAFAMQIAMGKEDIKKCPHVSKEAQTQLLQDAAPPMKIISIGRENEKINIGGETVMFRHEKTFYNPSAIGFIINESMPDEEIDASFKNIMDLTYDRVGVTLKPNTIAIKDEGVGKFIEIVKKACPTNKSLILMSQNASLLKEAIPLCKENNPIIFYADTNNYSEMGNIAKQFSVPVVVKGKTIEELADVSRKITAMGVENIILYPEGTINEVYKNMVLIRRGAILGKIKEIGYPVLTIPAFMTKDPLKETVYAGTFIAKYGSIVLLSSLRGESLFPLFLERLNIFTDPQKPMATPEGIYEVGKPDSNSPVLVTTNFSLTYFIVSGEIENARTGIHLLIQDAEGLSVLTAWAADKFNAETIATLVKKSKIEEKTSNRTLILPGMVAQIAGELEEELPGWKIVLGPREAAHLPAFLKTLSTAH
ncbi:MAG: acetyl-CoA decarbonylase/synthase complex subunit gamma [Candidatus Omnitrophica bacterium]|nr:acetyl-CoA decarbonylase/synthase complex subunit gamma [Candidatus Omnitrophota bacterium]